MEVLPDAPWYGKYHVTMPSENPNNNIFVSLDIMFAHFSHIIIKCGKDQFRRKSPGIISI